jgi:hypothetical protein
MRRISRTVVTLGVFTLALAGASLAQEFAYRVIAKVPFDFYAGTQYLPAGPYEFAVNYENHVVTMRNLETGHSSLLVSLPADCNVLGNTVVAFESIAGKYLLWDVQTPSAGVAFPEPRERFVSALKAETLTVAAVLK